MIQLVASTFIAQGTLLVYLDNNLIIQNSDTVTVELEAGQEYILHWFVKGEVGSTFSITVSAPREAQFQLTRAISNAKKDLGTFRFSC
ncbi:MAG: hypothetical protein KF775_09165 [Cyclobacteriaceae bacterium]|nr:hypothetical protein [Cytophagales bacterium]MBX2899810.1 hypothetical protein [Cyclobacteriaceae bacterium]